MGVGIYKMKVRSAKEIQAALDASVPQMPLKLILEKGRKGLADGTIREWHGKKFKKEGGKWKPVAGGRGRGRPRKEIKNKSDDVQDKPIVTWGALEQTLSDVKRGTEITVEYNGKTVTKPLGSYDKKRNEIRFAQDEKGLLVVLGSHVTKVTVGDKTVDGNTIIPDPASPMYQRGMGYDATSDYIPDFKNKQEKADWEAGLKSKINKEKAAKEIENKKDETPATADPDKITSEVVTDKARLSEIKDNTYFKSMISKDDVGTGVEPRLIKVPATAIKGAVMIAGEPFVMMPKYNVKKQTFSGTDFALVHAETGVMAFADTSKNPDGHGLIKIKKNPAEFMEQALDWMKRAGLNDGRIARALDRARGEVTDLKKTSAPGWYDTHGVDKPEKEIKNKSGDAPAADPQGPVVLEEVTDKKTIADIKAKAYITLNKQDGEGDYQKKIPAKNIKGVFTSNGYTFIVAGAYDASSDKFSSKYLRLTNLETGMGAGDFSNMDQWMRDTGTRFTNERFSATIKRAMEKQKNPEASKTASGAPESAYPSERPENRTEKEIKNKSGDTPKAADYTVTPVADTGFYEVTDPDTGKTARLYGQRGADIYVQSLKDMKAAGFSDMHEYVAYKNKIADEKRDAERVARESVTSAKEADFNTTKSDKPVHVDMEAVGKLEPKTRGRVVAALNKQYRYNGKVMTLRDIIESGAYNAVKKTQESAVQYNRAKFNRMDSKQQKEYEKRMAEKKDVYSVTDGDESMQVPKLVYDVLKTAKEIKNKSVVHSAVALLKARNMPVGTVSKGRKKMPDGSWRDVPTGTKKTESVSDGKSSSGAGSVGGISASEAKELVGKTVKVPIVNLSGNEATKTLKVSVGKNGKLYAAMDGPRGGKSSITDYSFDEKSGRFVANK